MQIVVNGGRTTRVAIGLVLLGIAGCSSSGGDSVAVSREGSLSLRAFSNLYAGYAGGQKDGSLSEQGFRDYIATKEKYWKQFAGSAEELLASPRTGEPLNIVYQGKLPDGPRGLQFFAFEKSGVEGQFLVVGTKGYYELMAGEEVKQLFAKNGFEF